MSKTAEEKKRVEYFVSSMARLIFQMEDVSHFLEDNELLRINKMINDHIERTKVALDNGRFDGKFWSAKFRELHYEFKSRLAGLEARNPAIRAEIDAAVNGNTDEIW